MVEELSRETTPKTSRKAATKGLPRAKGSSKSAPESAETPVPENLTIIHPDDPVYGREVARKGTQIAAERAKRRTLESFPSSTPKKAAAAPKPASLDIEQAATWMQDQLYDPEDLLDFIASAKGSTGLEREAYERLLSGTGLRRTMDEWAKLTPDERLAALAPTNFLRLPPAQQQAIDHFIKTGALTQGFPYVRR